MRQQMKKMKSLIKVQPGPCGMQLVQRPIPECTPGEVLIRVTAASICGSDLHMYLGEVQCKTGIIMGHEFAGEIVSTTGDVGPWRPGDRVTSELHVGACGRCEFCRQGMIMMCPAKTPPGWASDGAFAEYIKVPASLLHRVPDSVTDQMAALTEPIAGALGVINVLGIRPSDFVLVLGDGLIGLASAGIARALGAAKVAIVGRGQRCALRLDAARRMAFDMVLDHDREDVLAAVKDATSGLGADMVIEAAGGGEALRTATHAVRPAGRICAIGLSGKPSIPVEWDEMMRRRIQVAFAWSADSESFEKALSLLAEGSVSFPDGMISSYPLEKWREAFEGLEKLQIVKAQFLMS